jgi:hypothetical protein
VCLGNDGEVFCDVFFLQRGQKKGVEIEQAGVPWRE